MEMSTWSAAYQSTSARVEMLVSMLFVWGVAFILGWQWLDRLPESDRVRFERIYYASMVAIAIFLMALTGGLA